MSADRMAMIRDRVQRRREDGIAPDAAFAGAPQEQASSSPAAGYEAAVARIGKKPPAEKRAKVAPASAATDLLSDQPKAPRAGLMTITEIMKSLGISRYLLDEIRTHAAELGCEVVEVSPRRVLMDPDQVRACMDTVREELMANRKKPGPGGDRSRATRTRLPKRVLTPAKKTTAPMLRAVSGREIARSVRTFLDQGIFTEVQALDVALTALEKL